MHFYESSIITTKDGLNCQVYANEHPEGKVLVKPKYIPFDKIHSDALNCRFIGGKRYNRLDMWIDKLKLAEYIRAFKENYSEYIYKCSDHKNWFFCVPTSKIEKVYDPKKGLSELMKIPINQLDPHLKNVHELVTFMQESGIKLNDLGVTYSTLVGHYFTDASDINLVVHGKGNQWKLLDFLKNADHPLLRWKTDAEWLAFREKRSRASVFTKSEFLFHMKRKHTEGFFNDTLFLLFGVEEPNETWHKWGSETYEPIGIATIEGTVKNNFSSLVRPGIYELEDSRTINGHLDNIKKVVFHSRDYVMQALPGEKIKACGLLEKVTPKNGEEYYRLVIGYFDSYMSYRRGKEYIKVIN